METMQNDFLLSTQWSQAGYIRDLASNGFSVTYNEFCPEIDGKSCVTGCTNTAAAQLLYYFVEKKGLKLTLTLTADDEYSKGSVAIKADGSTPGTISFAEVNNHLKEYSVSDAYDAAALLYACGVVQKANYGVSATATAWNKELFTRAGFASANNVYITRDNAWYWRGEKKGDSYTLSDGAWEVLIENLENGSPVGTSYPGHALVIDGYDRETDTFHINFGWGNSSSTRWYTRQEILDEGYYHFLYDLEVKPVKTLTVTDADVYGTGTLIRAFERASGTLGANTINFSDKVKNKVLNLQGGLELLESTTVNNLNMSVRFLNTLGFSNAFYLNGESYFYNMSGDVIVNMATAVIAFYLRPDSSAVINIKGGLVFCGSYSVGDNFSDGANRVKAIAETIKFTGARFAEDIVAAKGRAVYGYDAKQMTLQLDENSIFVGDIYDRGQNILELKNNSSLYGNVTFASADDFISVYSGSIIDGILNFGSGKNILNIDSSSNITGGLSNQVEVNLKLLSGYRNDAIFTLESYVGNIYYYADCTIDISAAASGVYTLFNAISESVSLSTLKGKEFDFIYGDTEFSLSINGTSSNNYASLYFENNAVKLALAGTKDVIAPDVCTGLSAEMRGSDVYLDWQDATDNIGVANYLYRWSKSANFDGDGILTQGSSVTINAPDKGDYYYQVRSVDGAGNLSAWSAVQAFTVTEPRPDIVVNSLKLSAASIFDTKSVQVSFTIKSNSLPAAASYVWIYAGSSKIAELSVPALKVGESKNFTATISGKKLAIGKNTIAVVADASSLVKESNEKNNRATISLNVIKAFVNLTVKDFKISQDAIITKQALKINFTVNNSGNVESKATSAYIYDGKKILGKVSIKAIAAGKSLAASYTVAAGKLAFGTHQLYVMADGSKAIEESNEKDNQTASLTVKVAAEPKISKVTADVKGYSATLKVTPAVNVKVAKYVVTYGKKSATFTTNSFTISGLAVGKVAVSVVAYDAAGNKSTAKNVTLNVKDATAPSKVTTLYAPSVTNKYKGTFTWKAATDNSGKIAQYEIQLDNGKIYKSAKTTLSVSGLSVGKHTYRVRAIDKDKNVGAWSDVKSFTVKDMTAPVVKSVKATVKGYSATLNVSATDNAKVTKYVVTYGKKSATFTTNSFTISGLAVGKVAVSVVAYDAAGNKSTAKKITLNVKDATPPSKVTTLYAPSVTDKYKGTFTWKAATDNSGKIAQYEIQLDNGKIYKSSKTTLSVSGLSVGKHTYRVRAIDKDKNVCVWSDVKSFTVKDMTAPAAVSVSAKISGNDATLTWKKPKDNVGVTKYVLKYGAKLEKSVTLSGSATKYVIAGLAKGTCQYSMVAYDAAGNASKAKTGKLTIKQELTPAAAAAALGEVDFSSDASAVFAQQEDILSYCNELNGQNIISDASAVFAQQEDILSYCNELNGQNIIASVDDLTTEKKETRTLLALL